VLGKIRKYESFVARPVPLLQKQCVRVHIGDSPGWAMFSSAVTLRFPVDIPPAIIVPLFIAPDIKACVSGLLDTPRATLAPSNPQAFT